jgi:hypothetical protein
MNEFSHSNAGPINRCSFEDWIFLTRSSIYAACIAAQVRTHMAEGRGAPGDEDMDRFSEEAGAITDHWLDRQYASVQKKRSAP